MSNGLDAATRFPSSRLRRSPNARADARATVTGNANGVRPRCYPALSCPMRSIGHANAPQRNGDPVSAPIVSRYSTNVALTGRRTRLPVPRRRACGRTSTSKQAFKHCRFLLRRRLRRTRNRTFVRTHAVPRYPGQLTQAAEQLPRLSPHRSAAADGGTSTLRSYCAGSAIGESSVMGDASAAPNP